MTIPYFENPPLNEVICGIRFNKLGKLKTVDIGKYGEIIHSDYPLSEDREVLPSVQQESNLKIELSMIPPLRRVFFISQNHNRIIQFQDDCFFCNWHKIQENDIYPRFTSIMPHFIEKWEEFKKFIKEKVEDEIIINRYEMVYINHLYKGEHWVSLEDLKDIMPCFSWDSKKASDSFLLLPNDITWRLNFLCKEFNSRLSINLKLGKNRINNREVIVIELVMSTDASTKELPNLTDWFTNANQYIVKSFISLTSSEYHGKWGIKYESTT